MENFKKVSVVILNYNGKKWLEKFLPNVIANCAYDWCEVVVADNASTDDSITFLNSHFPNIRCIINEENSGYAGGYNIALSQINATYYVLLNSDVELTSNWLPPLVEFMDQHQDVAAVQPLIKSYNEKNKFEYAGAAGGFIDFLGYPFCRGRLFDSIETDTGQYNTNIECHWVSGACMLVRKNCFEQVGKLDADFFAHMEEIDICWRFRLAGYKLFCLPISIVYHVGGGTLPQGSPRKTYLNFRNNLSMIAKNASILQGIFIIAPRLVLDGVAAFHSCFKRKNLLDLVAILKAHLSFYGMTFKNLKKRKEVNQLKKQDIGLFPQSIIWQYFVLGKKKIDL
jgi:GT2 family glycosyltransferase